MPRIEGKPERENLACNTNINGLDMDLRKGECIRANITPQFILSRVPSEADGTLTFTKAE